MKETWKYIKDYENLYEISNFGNVKNKFGNIISTFNNKGYLCVSLYKNNKKKNYRIHRLVAEHFINNEFNKKEVNHIDGNKLNNNINNLEWVTSQENKIHAVQNGLNRQCISIIAKKNNIILSSKSIAGIYKKINDIEKINCKEKTFKENVRRALITKGTYYGYIFEKSEVML